MANLGYIQVTRECNQRCLFCSNPPSGRLASLAQLKTQAEDLATRGCDGIILTGGEPTLFPELPALVSHVASLGLPPRIITNGQRLSDGQLLDELLEAGLAYVHLSLYSVRPELQDRLSGNPGGFDRAQKTLERLGERVTRTRSVGPLVVDLNVVISRPTAGLVHEVAAFVTERLPFVRHVVFNNLDPSTDRVAANPDLVPRLFELELGLHRALGLLEAKGRSFRVERVPLCYLPDYEHVSTETRKIVKEEHRLIHFLDDKRLVCQQGRASWERGKAEACASCRLDPICAGLDSMDRHYSSAELAPVFLDPAPIVKRILDAP
ncbi:MAG: radical SAM protein [Polyangia bacterium]|jgi:MoaA/NifB/PqqE/SkfB family radical SAM enzyme|nr:radical SAM protein [Polyangia bacterium]